MFISLFPCFLILGTLQAKTRQWTSGCRLCPPSPPLISQVSYLLSQRELYCNKTLIISISVWGLGGGGVARSSMTHKSIRGWIEEKHQWENPESGTSGEILSTAASNALFNCLPSWAKPSVKVTIHIQPQWQWYFGKMKETGSKYKVTYGQEAQEDR
jgi:hypothetical protein